MPNNVVLVPDVRQLTADDLGVGYRARAKMSHASSAPDAPILQDNDPQLQTITNLLHRYGGVILSGPPGTGKSWIAALVAEHITKGDATRYAFIQFHPSYQFEDFMEGYRPSKNGAGFEAYDGIFVKMAKQALEHPNEDYVMVIDELSRADVGRVFGEALTYIERSKRQLPFLLPSGTEFQIPDNLLVICTMNPLDRGVDEVDAAFERRFAKVDMPPSQEILRGILDRNGLEPVLEQRLLAWFGRINAEARKTTPTAFVGHAYFIDVVDAETLAEVWDYQLKYRIDRAFQFDQDTRDAFIRGWEAIFAGIPSEDSDGTEDIRDGGNPDLPESQEDQV